MESKKLITSDNAQSFYRRVFQEVLVVPGIEYLSVASLLLTEEKFVHDAADYDALVAASFAQFQCEFAATAAIQHELPDATLEAIFMHPDCFGRALSKLDPGSVPLEKRQWLFEVSLRAHEYVFARSMITAYEFDDSYFEQIVDAAIDAKEFIIIIEIEPPDDWDKITYQWWIFGGCWIWMRNCL